MGGGLNVLRTLTERSGCIPEPHPKEQDSSDRIPGQWCQTSGIITWFDNFSVLLRRDGHTQLVYKHAISTVMPSVQIQLFEPDKEEAAEA